MDIGGINIIPENDPLRVAALDRYQIAGSERETAFDSICRLACALFAVPVSHISFLDADTEHIKAEVGLSGIQRVGRAEGFCALAILQPEVMLIEDASLHVVLAAHPAVTGGLMIRFYAAAPVITPDGFIIGTLCLIDQSPRSLSNQEIQLLQHLATVVMEQTELRNDNINLLQQRDKFIETAGHEMRTPLTALRAAAQLLKSKANGNDPLVAQVNRSIEKLNGIISDMFDTVRITNHTFELKRNAFELDALIKNCRDFATLVGKAKLDIEGDTNILLTGDEQKIERVLINLIQNAIKYAPGSPITVRVAKLQGFVKISVIDRGPGIAPDNLLLIFRRYYRANPDGVQSGMGLGLYISAEIVKQHSGEIGVETQAGSGCTFWFTLPVGV